METIHVISQIWSLNYMLPDTNSLSYQFWTFTLSEKKTDSKVILVKAWISWRQKNKKHYRQTIQTITKAKNYNTEMKKKVVVWLTLESLSVINT